MSLGTARSPYPPGLRPEPATPSGAYLAAPPRIPDAGGLGPPAAPPGAPHDQRRTRSFTCREPLWQSLEALSLELDCSIDYLINDALKQYLRHRHPERRRVLTSPPIPPHPHPILAPPPPVLAPPPPVLAPLPPSAPPLPTWAPVAAAPIAWTAPPPVVAALPPLRVHHRGVSHAVSKARFVIGRGKRGVDLVIHDTNVSRQHALIELVGGCFWLVDLGSTNGTERGGERVTRVPIGDGDHFEICGHSLWMSYRHPV
jgi:hypothetical protein